MENTFATKIINNATSSPKSIITRNILIDSNKSTKACILYSDSICDKDMIDRDILYPLMHNFNYTFNKDQDPYEFLLLTTLPLSNAYVETSFNALIDAVKNGKTILILDNYEKGLIFDTTSFRYRAISSPTITSSIASSKEDINESLELNMSVLKRHIKDSNLVVANATVGKRSKTPLSICYLKDVANTNIIDKITKRIDSIDVDYIQSIGSLQQYIEDFPFSFFPQHFITDSVETTLAKLYEGKVILYMEGSPYTLSTPSIFIEFFHNVDDYNQRTLVASFSRFLRFFAALVVLVLPCLYIVLTKFNSEFILSQYIKPIVTARQGIPLSPFLEIFSMELIVELLREGGIRLPSKVGQTLSIVSGIIIGDAAIKSNIISPPALFIIGISVVCTFLLPNYQMALSLRLLKFPLLFITNLFGPFGFFAGFFFILFILFNQTSFDIEYLEFIKSDFKDTFVRSPIPSQTKRPLVLKLKQKFRGRGNTHD